ncbi:heat shock factor 2-binding protein-like [Octopus sinensis]|uniref:Heat shock factor 2-binding protein-like n=1 Tax=Octopus sinensis TaxID=2607531 RepID=A0A7E6EVU0_9MOLL|nr:heat shock factor 2-binding protein-like [Octopus sinensis]
MMSEYCYRNDAPTTVSRHSLQQMGLLIKKLSSNLESWQKTWMSWISWTNGSEKKRGWMMVDPNDLGKLSTEIAQLSKSLPKLVNNKRGAATNVINELSKEINKIKRLLQESELERNHWKSRYDSTSLDCQNEKQRNLQLSQQVRELSEQINQQSDYTSSLGSACCTLLWRVSRSEESIQAILVGNKVNEFLLLVQGTLESFLTAYKEDWPQEKTDEEHFILAMCGIITNIAASAYGRDFLVNNTYGCQIIDIFITVLAEAPNKKSTKLKNLILMSLYNISINQKGLKYICNKTTLFQLLVWLLTEEQSTECCINVLRLLQSLVCEASIPVIHQLKEVLPEQQLGQLCSSRNKVVAELASDLRTDLNY